MAAGEAVDITWIKTLRLLRTLRPLRLISRLPGLKVVVEALIFSFLNVGGVPIVALLFFITFGILGVSLFGGKFFYCKGSDEQGMLCVKCCSSRPLIRSIPTHSCVLCLAGLRRIHRRSAAD